MKKIPNFPVPISFSLPLSAIFGVAILMLGMTCVEGQGTITFDGNPYFSGTNYTESGMWIRTIIPTGSSYDDIGVIGPIPPGGPAPQNSTPYMHFFQQFNPYDYVALSLTNGYSFGLTSVQLADPNSPSSSLVSISFVGFLSNGSTVTNTFTTPGGGATTFQNYLFTSAFASGLTSVDILSTRWAMDNLVFGNVAVPEPGAVSLLMLGLLSLTLRMRENHAKRVKTTPSFKPD